MTDKILIDRAVVEQALEMLNRINAADDDRDFLTEDEAVCTIMAIDELDAAICAALDHPQVEQEPVASIYIADNGEREFDDWRHDLPVGRNYLYTHPQNLNCKSTQARLATLCGYEKPQPTRQPLREMEIVEQEPVAILAFYDGVREPRLLSWNQLPSGQHLLYTHPQPRQPLTDEQISRLWSDAHNDTTDRMAFQVLARLVEAAHGIKEQK